MKADLSKKFRAALAECSTPEEATAMGGEFIEGLQVQLQEADRMIKTQGEKLELMSKGSEDVKELITAQREVITELKNNLRQTPSMAETKGKIDLREAIWHEALSAKARAELSRGEDTDKATSFLAQMPADQFTLTCQPCDEIGVDPKTVTGRAIIRQQKLSDFEALYIKFLARKDPEMIATGEYKKHPLLQERAKLVERLRDGVQVALADDAMSTINATVGGNWVRPEVLSAAILPYIENERVLVPFFENFPMQTKVQSIGVLASKGYPVRLEENDNEAGNATDATLSGQYISTYKATFTAKGYGTMVVATPWWFDDGIMGADFITRELASWMARGDERWLVSGQGIGGTFDAIDSPAPATTDIRGMSYGLRYHAKKIWDAGLCSPVDLGSGLTGEGAAKIFGRQGRWAHRIRQSIWVVSPVGMTACLLVKTEGGSNLVQTFNEMGSPGTFQTGVLARMYGRPIVVSDEVSEAMDANGYAAAGGTASAIYHVNTDAVKIGRRTGMRVEFSDQYRFAQHQDVFKVTARTDIQAGYNTASGTPADTVTEPFINAGVGLPSTL